MILSPDTQKLIDALDFRASRLELEATARAGIIVTTATNAKAKRLGRDAAKQAKKLRTQIQKLILKSYK